MKLILEKMTIGTGQRKFKAHAVDDLLTGTSPDFSDVIIFTSKNPEGDTDERQTNNTLYDVDSVRMNYYSAAQEDNAFKLPPIHHRDISQFNEYDFSLSTETSGSIQLALDKFKFFDRYEDMDRDLISYESTNFGSVNILPEMSEAQILEELMNIFGSANATGADKDFIDKIFTELHPSIDISQEVGALPFSYILETDLTRMQNVEPYGSLDVNLFKTKNHLKNDYNIYFDEQDRLVAFRRYKSIGRNFENIYLSYSVDHADASTNEYLTRNYETIEHISGFAKYKDEDSLHKSNIYSIRIRNSGLGVEGTLYEEIRKIFEKAIFNLMTKIAPAHCQLWKIEYIDE
jgi:hypothetical protein